MARFKVTRLHYDIACNTPKKMVTKVEASKFHVGNDGALIFYGSNGAGGILAICADRWTTVKLIPDAI